MNPQLVLQFMSQDLPWAFGLRQAMNEPPHLIAQAPLHEAPFFAALGSYGTQFRVVGADLEQCMAECLAHNPGIQPLPEEHEIKPTVMWRSLQGAPDREG